MKHLVLPAVLQLIVLTSTSGVNAAGARADQIAILHDGFGRETGAYVDRLVRGLQEDGFSVTRLSAQQVCDKEELAADKFFLYIIPNCRTYPAIGMDAIVNYARNRGHIMFLGGPFLDDPVWWAENGWMDKQLVLAAKKNAQTSNRPFGSPHELNATGWQRTTDDRSNSGSWEIVPEGPQGENCFRYTTERLQGWDGYLSPVVPRLYGQDHDLFVFEAKGATQTTQVAVEIQEQDGSRWIAVAGLTPEWNRIALELRDFKYWPDSQTRGRRGGRGDALNPAKAQRANFQLAHSHTTAVAPGEHSFWIANVGTAANPVAGMDVATATKGQTLETIFPRYKVHKVGKHTLVQPTNRHELAGLTLASGDDLFGGIPRTTGCGFQRGQRWRFIPLATASDPAKHARAYPAWLLLNQSEPLAGSVFACLGWNDTRQLSTPPMLQAVSRTARRLQLGVFLQEAGSEHFVCWPGEQIKFGATIVNTSEDEHELKVRLTVTDRCDETVLSDSHVVTVRPSESSVWEANPTLSTESSNDFRVTIELTAADRVIDTIEHDLSVLDTSLPEKEAFMQVEGNNFILHGQRWYPVGINYWPLYVSGMDHGDYWAGWIQRPYYDPDLVEQDLKRMRMLGINMVSIQSNDPQYYRNLLDFIHRCGRHGIYVNLFCGLASPISLREKELRDFIETARLANNQHIMAYDTIWEPGNYLFRHDWRRRWDPDWRQWIMEQYGDIEWAEQDWQFECPRDDAGRPVAPPDKYFREDGRWRAMMAAYRGFMDDLMSRKWNRAHGVLRRLDPNHLISFRQGNTLPHDFTLTATAKHVDFICPEGYAIPNTEDGYYVAGFITKYVHFTTSGKPIVWSEFGQSAWDPQRMEPSESRIREVSDYHDLFYRMVLETGANGTVPWWWPGGYRVGERSDYGITDPDGTPRPAAMLISKYSSQLTADRDWPAPTTWYEMDRDKHAGGYWHVCFNAGRDAQRQAVAQGGQLGIRTDGTGTTSANTPMVAVGNRPLNGRNPPKYLNAEFNRLQILDTQGQWVHGLDGARIHVNRNQPILARVSVGNTQEATWIVPTADKLGVGDVVLATTESSQLQGQWPLPRSTSYLKDADFGEIQIARGITSTKLVELRMQAHGRTGFGEKRTFFLEVK